MSLVSFKSPWRSGRSPLPSCLTLMEPIRAGGDAAVHVNGRFAVNLELNY